MELLGKRWDWEKTKVWRFLKKHSDTFALYSLPGAFGCILFNRRYPTGVDLELPGKEEVLSILQEIRTNAQDVRTADSDNERLNKMIAWRSRRVLNGEPGQFHRS